jgi:hypothetical protein
VFLVQGEKGGGASTPLRRSSTRTADTDGVVLAWGCR